MLNSTLLLSLISRVGLTVGGHAAKIFMPGAVTSGFITSGAMGLGPLEENAAIIGAGEPYTVPSKVIEAIGFFVTFRIF